MKRSISRLVGCTVRAKDGDIGTVKEFYFDDHRWTIRYMIVDTGRWLRGRQVLISTAALKKPQWKSGTFPVNLTKAQVKNSPSIDTNKPVSRQHEAELYDYYGWPVYWGGQPFGGGGFPVPAYLPATAKRQRSRRGSPPNDPHLRSTRQVTGYHILASDGAIGHVEDLLVDDETWAIRYVVVNTRNLLPGKNVLVSPHWIKRVSWSETDMVVNLSREAVQNSPEFDPSQPVKRTYEDRLFDHYGQPKYWTENQDSNLAQFPCQRCGRNFLSKIEWLAHRQECRPGKPPRQRKAAPAHSTTSLIDKIEESRPKSSNDYRAVDRSS